MSTVSSQIAIFGPTPEAPEQLLDHLGAGDLSLNDIAARHRTTAPDP